MATNTTTETARAAVLSRVATINLLSALGTREAADTAVMAVKLLGFDLDDLIKVAKAEGAREEAARLLALRAESDTLAAEQSNA